MDAAPSAIPEFLRGAFTEVLAATAAQGVHPAGPPFARYAFGAGGFDLEAGFRVAGTVSPSGRVEAWELPGGSAAQVLYRGDYGGVSDADAAVSQWVAGQGFVATGPPWETDLDAPDVADPRTVVSMPCGPG